MVEGFLRQGVAAIDAVHELQRAPARPLDRPLLQPSHELLGLVHEAEPHQPIQRERRIPDPGVAVIPVAHATDLLRETAGGCRDHGPGRREGQELEHHGRAVHEFTPAPGMAEGSQPLPPVVQGFGQEGLPRQARFQEGPVMSILQVLQDKRGALARLQHKFDHYSLGVTGQREATDQGELHRAGSEDRAASFEHHLVWTPGKVECWLTFQAEADGATDSTHHAHNLMGLAPLFGLFNGHEVHHLTHPLDAEKAGQQDTAVWQVHLFVLLVVQGGDLEEATFLVVQDGGKKTGRVKVWQAAPVDRAIDPDQSYSVESANHPIAFYGFVAHVASSSSEYGSLWNETQLPTILR